MRIGVLDGQSNPSPITFTDYVQVQAGEGNSIRVSPLSNDVDPTMGTLASTDVRPGPALDAWSTAARTDEYDAARRPASLRRTMRPSWSRRAMEPATMSFLYDVESSSGNTGRGPDRRQGRARERADYPVVDDTVADRRDPRGLPLGRRRARPTGLVVGRRCGRPRGGACGATRRVSRSRARTLRGALPETTRVIPFAVTGEGPDGPVTTYAFLRVPGDDDLSLALRASAAPPEVTELESVSFDMTSLVAKPRGSTLEVGADVRASGARSGAVCTVESATTVRYDSGAGAPWVDACQVPVRIAGQSDWTYLSVPIIVNALDPQPALQAGSMTVGPGETATFDLRNMTSWQLREDWERHRVRPGVLRLGVRGLTRRVDRDGRRRRPCGAGLGGGSVVSVTSHTAVAPVRLILRVGAAPSTLPRGGSVAQQCSQATGSSCTIAVIGASGEVNPLPRTPLDGDRRARDRGVRRGELPGRLAQSVLAPWRRTRPVRRAPHVLGAGRTGPTNERRA